MQSFLTLGFFVEVDFFYRFLWDFLSKKRVVLNFFGFYVYRFLTLGSNLLTIHYFHKWRNFKSLKGRAFISVSDDLIQAFEFFFGLLFFFIARLSLVDGVIVINNIFLKSQFFNYRIGGVKHSYFRGMAGNKTGLFRKLTENQFPYPRFRFKLRVFGFWNILYFFFFFMRFIKVLYYRRALLEFWGHFNFSVQVFSCWFYNLGNLAASARFLSLFFDYFDWEANALSISARLRFLERWFLVFLTFYRFG